MVLLYSVIVSATGEYINEYLIVKQRRRALISATKQRFVTDDLDKVHLGIAPRSFRVITVDENKVTAYIDEMRQRLLRLLELEQIKIQAQLEDVRTRTGYFRG